MQADHPASAAERLNGIVGLALGAQEIARTDDAAALDEHLRGVDPEFLGFAIEGSAMGLTMLDEDHPTEPARLDRFLTGPWQRFSTLMHAGAGLGLAELHHPVLPYAVARHDLDAWFAIDGYAFHLALLAPDEYLSGGNVPSEFQNGAARLFDRGLARSVWFTSAADPEQVAEAIGRFGPERRGDLWCGLGLAATYAAGLDDDGLAVLGRAAGAHRDALAVGAALAAHTRILGDNLVVRNDAACRALTGRSAVDAHALCTQARTEVQRDGSLDAFLGWGERIHDALAAG